jgi:hypothetical protein
LQRFHVYRGDAVIVTPQEVTGQGLVRDWTEGGIGQWTEAVLDSPVDRRLAAFSMILRVTLSPSQAEVTVKRDFNRRQPSAVTLVRSVEDRMQSPRLLPLQPTMRTPQTFALNAGMGEVAFGRRHIPDTPNPLAAHHPEGFYRMTVFGWQAT